MSKQAMIKIILVGTEGELDRPEEEFAVMHLKDQAENAKLKILEMACKYPKYGWSLFRADKEITEEELNEEKVIDGLQKEIARLGKFIEDNEIILKSAHTDTERFSKYADKLQAENKQLQIAAGKLMAENVRLREALEKYGGHGVAGGDICEASKHSDYSCTCGFEQVLKGGDQKAKD